MAKGFIKLYRDIEDTELWISEEPFDKRSAWIDLLLMANHADKDVVIGNHTVKVKRGQKLTSVRKLSKRWHWGKDRTLAYLRLLENLGMIHRYQTLNATLITLINYDKTQDVADTYKDTVKDTIKDTIKDTYKDTTKDTTKPLTIMYKNDIKNDKERKESAPLNSFGFPIEE